MKKRCSVIQNVLLALLLLGRMSAFSQISSLHNLMPVPRELKAGGTRFCIRQNFRVSVTGNPDPRLYAEASRFIRRLAERTGIFLDKQGYVSSRDNDPSAPLLIKVMRPGRLKLYEDETYSVDVKEQQITIAAPTDLGAIHGIETLLQLLSTDEQGYYFPGVSIKDGPRFAWRGLLLDVALHFMPVDVIKRTLDGMAAVKLNVLHLHLCNDQGFRVESKVFPQLQLRASDGLYYSQEDIRGIIHYAGQRGIRVVPEFVVPAHTTAILTAFPELASVKRKYTLQRLFGVFDPVLDPTNEKVYVFLDKLFTEMAHLFPDAYFHIGGDENTGKDWKSNPKIRAYMKARGMKNTMDLQTAFNKRILPVLQKNGKTMMGWDEILQPGLPKNIVIQSWRGKEAFYSSLKKGYKAILSNGYYIDLIQPASFHYLNDPAPDSVGLSPEEIRHILGGEATMWSEMVTPETVDSRIWPRTAAIAERFWSPREIKDTDDMYRRLDIISLQLEALGLRHESYKQGMMRRLANGYDTKALEVLASVIEPLKIYERNQGDTMYSVFSPFTKIADLAAPDPPLPRIFRREVDLFLKDPGLEAEKIITDQLLVWKNNHVHFMETVRSSPALQEALSLSANLSSVAAAGLAAMEMIHNGKHADGAWLAQQLAITASAREQGGRCELQVVDPIEKLINAAAGHNGH